MKNEIRAFIGLEISSGIRRELVSIQKNLHKLQGDIAWVKCDNLHLSIRFLGNITPEQIKDIEKISAKVARELKIFPLSLGALGVFPNIYSPKVIWAGISSGYNQVTKLHTLIDKELTSINFKTADRHFHPHITLARIKSIKNKSKLSDFIDTIKLRSRCVDIKKLTLYKSKLDPKGAIYTKIQEAKLGKY